MTQTFEKLERVTVPAMDEMLGKPFKVLDHGFVRVIDYMGDESSIAQMARTSYGKGTKSVNEDIGLLRYLLRHRHTSPFEGNELKLHIRMPIFVMRQWVRHRTASLNEYSMRYSEPSDEFYIPELDDIKQQSNSNKQGRDGELDLYDKSRFQMDTRQHAKNSMLMYENYNERGLARELNRINLPVNAYTECYWKINAHNLMHFLKLRADSHAQYEIRVFAEVILEDIFAVWMPNVYEAFVEYIYNAKTFSDSEIKVIKEMAENLGEEKIDELLTWADDSLKGRQLKEFKAKLGVKDGD